MIRMGRGNRPEPSTGELPEQKPAEPAYRYANEVQTSTGRAISESDSMARDIKEGRLSGFVGHGTTLTGETEFHAMLRVDGHLIGTVTSEAGTLIIGTNGQVDANVMVAAAMINGTVNGDVIATEKLRATEFQKSSSSGKSMLTLLAQNQSPAARPYKMKTRFILTAI